MTGRTSAASSPPAGRAGPSAAAAQGAGEHVTPPEYQLEPFERQSEGSTAQGQGSWARVFPASHRAMTAQTERRQCFEKHPTAGGFRRSCGGHGRRRLRTGGLDKRVVACQDSGSQRPGHDLRSPTPRSRETSTALSQRSQLRFNKLWQLEHGSEHGFFSGNKMLKHQPRSFIPLLTLERRHDVFVIVAP